MKFSILIFILIFFSCEISEPFEYTSNQNVYVLNSLLSPDSTIHVRLTRSLPYPGQEESVAVTDAIITIEQENTLVGQLEYIPDSGYYSLDYYPVAGKSYTIHAGVHNKQLVASTRIPSVPEISGCYSGFISNESRFNKKAFGQLHILSKLSNPLWFGCFSDYHPYTHINGHVTRDSTIIERNFFQSLYSSSAYTDRFNSIQDNGLTSYEFYIRLPLNETFDNHVIDLFSFETNYFFLYPELQNLSPEQGLYTVVLNASDEFDKYMKSTLINFLNNNIDNETPNPFAEQVLTYSNVQNGAGVVAGYSQVIVPFYEEECN